ncbi:YlmH/Sll1252 family protein [Sporolactobacillus sp. CQH2019]|uniref:YlmH family RNA-binding protein n=1 Tax=Sporolactobacillus sp. CQH2019 TaxID=3023512 RepID=UPI0023689926|nr:YlmH/Sll1252 family protein [Sporolactobacillus sp. CQH2019]MDD9147144.1 YlmH/Sll1252 family protein [Sporolactobacillus sp. CQH2019]
MSVYEHFRREERPIIDHFLDLKDQVSKYYAPKLTDFLDPRRQKILHSVIGGEEITFALSGGHAEAERKRALILPPYCEAREQDFGLSYIEVDYPSRFADLSHAQLLGALLGTGLVRSKLGDLIVSDGRVQFIAATEVEKFLLMNLTSVGKTAVTCRKIDRASLIHSEESWLESEGTVASLRLDAVMAEIYHLSRSKVSELVARGMAKVNWQIVDRKDFYIEEGDTLSLRGYGRSKIIVIAGLTKKNKIRLRYGKLK